MNRQNKIKAAFLLIVFALNTVVSFACSVGLIDFNKDHHKHTAAHDKPHGHEHAKPHAHGKTDHHQHTGADHHQHAKTSHHHDQSTGEEEKNCCSDDVVKVSTLDKLVTNANQNPLPLPVEAMAAIYAFLLPHYYDADLSVKPKPPFDRSWVPTTISDLRIVIQSFQI